MSDVDVHHVEERAAVAGAAGSHGAVRAAARALEIGIALGELLEIDDRPVLGLDAALPAITAAVGPVHG